MNGWQGGRGRPASGNPCRMLDSDAQKPYNAPVTSSQPVPASLAAALADRYRLDRVLGAGGMATVYLAQDLRHSRPVALKVLKPELSAIIGAERFLVEIRTTANLQHPHILPLFDSGQVEGTVYYVMPFVEGEALRDRLNREKQLPIEDAVRIASEVASALDYAHRQGVIHRDIKPENILLHDGRAVVADFGIALAASRTDGGSRLTETGMSLGTPHYMSPEQALGERNIDARTDVYALGCVLHEMLVGEPPFSGPTAQAVIARVLGNDPEPVSATRRTVPEYISDAVLTALAKLPADRFATAALFASALTGSGHATITRRHNSGLRLEVKTGWRNSLARAAWPLAFAAAVALAAWGWMRPTPKPISTRLALSTPSIGGAATFLQKMLDISPDGTSIIYLQGAGGGEQLVLHRLDEELSRPLAHIPANFSSPVFSPDGRSVVASNIDAAQVFKFSLEGGRGVALPQQLGASSYTAWGDDGAIWISPLNGFQEGVTRVAADGAITHPLAADPGLAVQQVLPGSRYGLAVRSPLGTSFGQAFIVNLRTGESEPILGADVVEVRYAAGILAYVVGSGTLEAVRFDLGARRTIGEPVEIATDVSLSGGGGANFAMSANGTLAFVPEAPRSLLLIDRDGASRPAVSDGRTFHMPRFSPDGRSLLTDFATIDGRDVWRLDLASQTLTRVSFERDGHDADWDPDGRGIIFITASRAPGTLTLLRTAPGRSSGADSLISSPLIGYTGEWLPDQSAIVTAGTGLSQGSKTDIAIIRNGGRGPIEPLVSTPFEESYPAVSPDGRWLAYTSDQTGTSEIYLRPLGRDGDEIRVSANGGSEPTWGPDGRELFYRALTGGKTSLVAARISFGAAPAVSDRRTLFDVTEMASSTPHTNYDISPDGKRFAMVRRNPSGRVVIIQHLPQLVESLERRGRQ